MRSTVIFIAIFTLSISSIQANIYSEDVINLPYKKVGNLIVVEAEVEGKKGNFIMDTGFPDLCLNVRYFNTKSVVRFEATSTGINGQTQNVQFIQTKLKVAGIKVNQSAQLIDLSHLEKRKGFPIYGLIGQSFFRNFEVLFDLINEKILLIPLDKKGNRLSAMYQLPQQEIPFLTKKHFPLLKASVNGKQLWMGLDTGAEFNVIESDLQKDLMNNAILKNKANLTNGGVSKQTATARLRGFSAEELECRPMMTIFSSMEFLNKSLPGKIDMDGLLGIEFLVQHKISINYRKKTLNIWGSIPDTSEIIAASYTGKIKN